MKLQRFFIKEPLVPGKILQINDKTLVDQIRKVFRKKVGDSVGLLDNSGKGYIAEIADFGKTYITFNILEKEITVFIPDREVWLYVSIPKKDKFEWIVEKATELGVSHVVPVISERTEKQNIKWDRVERIAKEASEQSERGVLPVIHEKIELKNIDLDKHPIASLHMEGIKFSESGLRKHSPVGVLVGPEGGWAEGDIKFFKQKDIPLVSLGTQVLRAETASIAICSLALLG